MKILEIVGDNYFGNWTKSRTGCRAVIIKDGKITDVSVKKTDDDSEDPESNELYFGYAADGRTKKGKHYDGIPDQIKDHQSSSGLDAVSGATYSSKAMIKAAEKALSDAENPDAKGN